jgi:hypothetical protein
MAAATAAALPAERAAVLYRQVAAVLVSAGLDRGTADRALQALADGAVVPSAIPGAYHVASSNGEDAYLTGTTFCSCPATTARCYHRVAVIIVAAAGHQP